MGVERTKGLILAGGHGTRLHPTTKVINKHLVLIFDKPLIFYAIHTLRDIGIKDITITLGNHESEKFYDLLGSGRELGVNLTYHHHGEPKGIAYAINSAKEYLDGDSFVTILGDNIFTSGLLTAMNDWKINPKKSMVVLKQMNNRAAYGVASVETRFNRIRAKGFFEKSLTPASEYAVLGAYFLQPNFFSVFDSLEPSGRGEYEIVDALNKLYPETSIYEDDWFDCGTFDDIYKASRWRRRCVLGET